MKTYVFHIEHGGSANKRFFAADGENQSEAAHKVYKKIGSTYFTTGLVKVYAHKQRDNALRTYKNLVTVD